MLATARVTDALFRGADKDMARATEKRVAWLAGHATLISSMKCKGKAFRQMVAQARPLPVGCQLWPTRLEY